MSQPPLRLLRLANPLVRAVLDSGAHRLLSGRLVVVEYRGRQSGRTFRVPLRFAQMTGGAIVALAVRPERKLWWRSFITPTRAVLRLRGERVEAKGAVAERADRDRALAAYVAHYPRTASLAHDAAVVVFTPRHG